MLSDRCPVPSCLSVSLLYCGQTVGWIKIPLGTEVGLSPGDIVLYGEPAPPRKGAQQQPPLFGLCLYTVAKRSPISATAELLLRSSPFYPQILCFTMLFHRADTSKSAPPVGSSTARVSCSNAAKTRNPLKLPGVPQTNETISAASGPKFTILWRHVEEILLLDKFFFDCRYMP